MTEGLKKIESKSLNDKLATIDEEFKDYLSTLVFRRDFVEEDLRTFSPLNAVMDFEPRGLQAIEEVTREEMLQHDSAFHKLLANMLYHCKPGSLTADDVEQIAGINGREIGL